MPRDPPAPLGSLGWRGRWKYDDAEVVKLRETLEAEAGIPDLEADLVDPAVPGFAKRAAEIFHRDGFCLVKDALTREALDTIREGCDTTIRKILQHDPDRRGNRDSHRYSFAGSPQKFGCARNWSVLIDCAPVLECLTEIWGSDKFTCSGYGGDFVLPGAVEYQHMHRDGGLEIKTADGGAIDTRNLSPFLIVVNYPMVVKPGEPAGHTKHNGVTRFVKGTQNTFEPTPSLSEEPRWMKLAVTAPVPAGCALIRDVRCWHGGTPNGKLIVSREVRGIPSAGFHPPWYKPPPRAEHDLGSLPHEVWAAMSKHAKQVCKRIVAAPGVDVTAHASWSPETDLGAQPGWRFWREPKTAEGEPAHGVGSLLAKL